ncbi:MAG: ABC transporter substrate-binding protein [Burkholderiales bacterium]|nr:ABC transporter substrate-binding protein [Burkholderiales bacterium]
MYKTAAKFSLKKVAVAVAVALGAAVALQPVSAQNAPKAPLVIKISDGVVKIGLLNDMNSLYADITGQGTVEAVKLAVEEFGGKVHGFPIEVIVADHQNKADLAAAKAREWFDSQKVDILGDVGASATALAASEVAKQRNKLALLSGPGASRLTNESCNAVTIHYAWDTYALAAVVGRGVVKGGGDSWFFLTADYAFGQALEKDTTDVIKAEGGKVLGSVRHPLNTNDFSSFMLQAQASKAKIIGLANAGGDTTNSIKAANEFGLTKNQKLAGLLLFDNDVHSLGLQVTQGMLLASAFYWDMNDETRKWSRRYFEKMKKMPNMLQAGAYSSTLQYLKAVKATGTDDTDTINKWLRSNPINDMFVKNGYIRADGRMMREMYLFEVKTPAASKYPWDYFKLKATVPADKAYRPLSESVCPLVKK